MPLRFYNTLSQQTAEFAPQRDNTVRMYTCGPTVYDYAHIGNFRTFTFMDILRRWLRASGFRLDHVMNITDVDDKIIRNAVAQNQSLDDYTAHYKQAFRDDCALLRLETPEHVVPATEHIHEMAEAIERLTAGGHTYASHGSIYFRISTFPKEGEVFWDEKIGRGRPGWHIECSVMAIEYLGETLDIHAGGLDLIFPHHENEIAQSESLTGKPFARFWLHAEFLMVEGQKMSKSLGNYFTLRDILGRGYAPEAVRYLLASVPYRKTLNFTFDGLQSAKTAIERLRNFKLRLATGAFADGLNPALVDRTAAAQAQFTAAMDDDLNTAEALAAMFEYLREVNTAMDAGDMRAENRAPALEFLTRFDSVFAVLEAAAESGQVSDAEVEAQVQARNDAKKARNFELSDRIRQQLLEQGIILEDTKSGTRWKRKSS